MTRKLLSYVLSLSLCASILLPATALAESAPSPQFSLSTSSGALKVNNEFQVVVSGAQLTDLFGYEVNVKYDTSRLIFKSAVSTNTGFSIDPIISGNTIQLAHTQVGQEPGKNGNLPLFTLTFKAINQGTAAVELTSLNLVNSQLGNKVVTTEAKASVAISDSSDSGSPGDGGGNPTTGPSTTDSNSAVQLSDGTAVVKLNGQLNTASQSVTAALDLDLWNQALSMAVKDDTGLKKIRLDMQGAVDADVYILQLPRTALSNYEDKYHVELNTPIAFVTTSNDMIQKGLLTSDNVEVHIAKADLSKLDENVRKRIGDRPAIEMSLHQSGQTVAWNNPDVPVSVRIPYKPSAEELQDPEHIVVWYIDGQGQAIPVPNGKYNAATGDVTFFTTHFSTFAVTFVQKTFDDILTLDWAKHQIEVLASKGIINGTSDSSFSPTQLVSRADFIVLLMRTLELKGTLGGEFADVGKGQYYTDAIRLARGLGITDGIGDNRFNPSDPITREDMMVLAARALHVSGQPTSSAAGSTLSEFDDAASISGYAVDSVAALVGSGLVHGYDHGIHPQATTTRAETAVFMYNMYNK